MNTVSTTDFNNAGNDSWDAKLVKANLRAVLAQAMASMGADVVLSMMAEAVIADANPEWPTYRNTVETSKVLSEAASKVTDVNYTLYE